MGTVRHFTLTLKCTSTFELSVFVFFPFSSVFNRGLDINLTGRVNILGGEREWSRDAKV